MEAPKNEKYIFALDIGTRSVIGVVCKREGNVLKIVAESIMEHDSRSMIDGQVHDVDKVADVVSRVRDELEGKVGFPLKEVAIAAAGRTLKTKSVHVEQDLGDEMDIDSVIINGLELSGVSEANMLVAEDNLESKDHFYCVGYSIVSYYINGYSITNLLDQRGRYIGADLLATFLPQSVVNSLYRVLDKCNLTAVSLTLEPIAAMEAIVPENIRLLNIALVDIGAGTSDIAITRRGAIVAYGMVPVAGDEVTEAIAEEYLVDFNAAENIKRGIGKKKKISFKDITGAKRSVDAKDILNIIGDSGRKAAKEISSAILKYNGEPPKAVFCVGGGSQTQGLIESIADELHMDKQRIALKKRDSIQNLDAERGVIRGPEGVTVIGIALVALKKVGHDFINIYVNGKEYRLFNSSDLAIRDVLGLIGYNPSSLIGRSGKSIKFILNGEHKKVPGGVPTPPQIYINDDIANLETIVKNGDFINIKDAVNGEDAAPTIYEVAAKYGIGTYGRTVTSNGRIVSGSYIISDGDDVTITDEGLKDVSEAKAEAIKDDGAAEAAASMIENDFTEVTVNGARVVIKKENPIFVDIFNVIDFDLSKPKGIITLKLNGRDAGYSDMLRDGDVIEVYWKNPDRVIK